MLARANSRARTSLTFATLALRVSATQMSSCATEPREVPFVLFGTGGVGAALLKAIVGTRTLHAERYGVRFSAIAVCDSSASVGAAGGVGLSDEAIVALLSHKAAGNKLSAFAGATVKGDNQPAADFLKSVATQCATASPGCILVDCTGTDATVPALLMSAGGEGVPDVRAVLSNKKPVADRPMSEFTKLALAPRSAARFRYEATVGAGLPVIAVSEISGSFSGTLGYVMSGLQEGRPFSEVVSKAKELGYTEPDPRDDLGGVDVARKALILARMLGIGLEMEDVQVTPLYPEALAALSVPEFMAALPSLDASFANKVASAAAKGQVLR